MSNRFHNKYHRHNHHTRKVQDLRYPDSSHDPIASHESPFLGDFVLNGTLSATDGVTSLQGLSSFTTSVFTSYLTSEPAIITDGDANINGNLTVSNNGSVQEILSTGKIEFTQAYTATTMSLSSVSATGEFLIFKINGFYKAVRLWDFEANLEDVIVPIADPTPLLLP